ncbi:rna polymerase I subunit [Aspergillus sp. HF37]|nr:rna polymerase I subunit [Aspergillus sp. HF37]
MAADAMDVDPPHTAPADPERKRKHKNKHKDASPSKKRKHESTDGDKKSKKAKGKSRKEASDEPQTQTSQPADDSPFTLTTATLYLPLSPISISPTHAVASLLAEHLSPLLLTYYPPLKGIVLAYSNASISETPPPASAQNQNPNPNPQPLTLATSANEYGVLYVYLTATFLVFRPQRGHVLDGWVNVQSEGFLGAVVLNLFSVGIERKRLPTDWRWIPPGEEADKADTSAATSDDESQGSPAFDPLKEHFSPVTLASDENPLADAMQDAAGDEASAAEGSFRSVSGHRVRGTVRFRVVDVDVIPGTDRDRGFLSIEGSMLSPDEEAGVLQDERGGVLSTPRRGQSPSMSGAQPAQEDQAEESGSKEPAGKEKKDKGKDGEKKSKKKKKDSHE